MNPVKNQANPPAEIIEYLNAHPDFFLRRPDLLTQLDIPHITGADVVSLIEYRAFRLRRELDELRNSLSRTEYDAARHRELIGNIHALTLELLAARTPENLYNLLRRDLKRYYSADKVLVLIFTRVKTIVNYAGLKSHGFNHNLRFQFAELFPPGKPLCDSLQEEHLRSLFGESADLIRSTVLLPFAGDGWQELLALGSFSENRYRHGLELDLLKYTNEIVCRAIYSWIAE